MMNRMLVVLLSVVLSWSGIAAARYLGPTAHGYYFHASSLPSEIYLPAQLEAGGFPTTATIVVHVRDVNRIQVDGMPVRFQLLPQCETIATLSATRAVTRDGKAEVTLSGKDVGACHIAIRVDNVTKEIWVQINPPTILPGIR